MEAKKSDIRRLFFTKVDIRDELSFHEMESNYMKEKSARERVIELICISFIVRK